MSVFIKTTDGLLYHEDFSQPNSLLWTLSPSYMSNVLEFGAKGPVVTEKGLRIKHSNKYVTYLMPEPSGYDEYSVIFSIGHYPISSEDIGGVIVMSSTLQYLECQTFLGHSESGMVNGDEFLQELRESVQNVIDEKVGDLDRTIDSKVDAKCEEKCETIDSKIDGVDSKVDTVDEKVDNLDEGFDERVRDLLVQYNLISVFSGGGEGGSGFMPGPDIPGFGDDPFADSGFGGGSALDGPGFGPSLPSFDDTTSDPTPLTDEEMGIDNTDYDTYGDESDPLALDINDTENEDNEEETEDDDEDGPSEPEVVYDDVVYRYIKVYKAKHKYYFYASADIYAREWIEVGNAQLDTGSRIGLFLYGTQDYNTLSQGKFKCNWVDFYSSKYITLHGIDLGKDFVILSDGREVFRSDVSSYQHLFGRVEDTIEINTTELPVPMENAVIKLYARNNYEEQYGEYEVGTLYGGDVLDFMLDLRMYINSLENPIEVDTPYDLGTFYKGNNYVKLIIQNCDTEPAEGLTVSIMKYSPYYEGEQEVYIAPYEEGTPMNQIHFEKSITLDIQSSDSKSVYVRLYDTPLPGFDSRANDFRFKVVLK